MIGIAIIGLGPASQPHIKALRELAGRVDVRWAASRSAARLADCAATTPFPTTTDIDAVLADPTVQAVVLLTPPFAHLELAERAFAAGKHVLVEKPLEVSLERAEKLVDAAERSGKLLGVVLQHRFRPGARTLAALLAEGRLGDVQGGSMTVPWWRPQSYYDEPGRGSMARDGGGVLLTQAVHTIDLFRALVDVRHVVASSIRTTALHRMETEDLAMALVELGNGAPGTIVATTAAYPGRSETIELIGTKGTARLTGGSLEVDFIDGTRAEEKSDARTGSGAGIMDFDHGPHKALLEDFLGAIEQNRAPLVTGADALATQRLIDTIIAKASG